MTFEPTFLQGSYIVNLLPRGDNRGWFMRSFCKKEFAQIGHTKEWVQMNHSFTSSKGTIRGMHFQIEPYQEIKMVRCIVGSVFDVIIDLRQESLTYLKWFGVELSAKNKKMLYVPEGFAHGFQTLTDDVELLYHHSEFYQPGHESGISYNDPKINIQWPLPLTEMSERDKNHRPLL